jgi:C4-dicarboxylate transporter, DctQ subunit
MSEKSLASTSSLNAVKTSYQEVSSLIKTATRLFSWIAGGAVLSLFVLEFGNVLLRVIFNYPFKHTDEIVRFNMAWIVYLGFAYTLRTGGHISIDALTSHMREDLRKKLNKVSVAMIAVWIGLITYGGWKLWLDLFRKGQRSFGLLEVELWIPGLCIILGLSLFLLEATNEMIGEFLGITGKSHSDK